MMTALQDLGHLVEVIGCTADGVTRLVRVVVRKRQTRGLISYGATQREVEALGEAAHHEGLDAVEHPRRGPDSQVEQDFAPAVGEVHDKGAALLEGLLDVDPQKVDETGAEGGRRQAERHVQHGAHGGDNHAPALAGRGLPQAARAGEAVGRDLGLAVGAGRALGIGRGEKRVLLAKVPPCRLVVTVSHCHSPLPLSGSRRSAGRRDRCA